MRLIDIDALPDDCWWCGDELIEAINNAPTVEPEIIRCRDCKNHVLHPRIGVPWCKLLHSDMGDNQFCSYAKRREVD